MKGRSAPVDRMPAPPPAPPPKRGKGEPGVPTVMDRSSMARALINVPAEVRVHMVESLPLSACREIIHELVGMAVADARLIDTMREISQARAPAYAVHHAGPHRSGTDGSLGGGWTP